MLQLVGYSGECSTGSHTRESHNWDSGTLHCQLHRCTHMYAAVDRSVHTSHACMLRWMTYTSMTQGYNLAPGHFRFLFYGQIKMKAGSELGTTTFIRTSLTFSQHGDYIIARTSDCSGHRLGEATVRHALPVLEGAWFGGRDGRQSWRWRSSLSSRSSC